MNSEARRQRLIDAFRHLTPEMKETLRERKEEGLEQKDRPDYIWHSLLQSFATMGNARGWDGLIGSEENYNRVTFEALSGLDRAERLEKLDEVLRTSKVRMPSKKAIWLDLDFEMIIEMGGPEAARRQALAQDGRERKVAFLQHFHGIGDKYARNIWMDVYHPDFRDAIAVDERIKRVTEALGYSFKSYAEHERFYQEIARAVGLEGWEVDRLLYNHQGEFLAIIDAGREEQAAELGNSSVSRDGDPPIHETSRGIQKDNRFSTIDLVALSGLPRALDILAETIDAEVREELARFSGNKPQHSWANLMQQLRSDEGYWVYDPSDREDRFGCYIGYEMRHPDGYPRLQVGLYAEAGAAESEAARAAVEKVASLDGWHSDSENAEEYEVRRELNVASLLGEKDHVAAVKAFYIDSVRRLEEELTTFKMEHPDLPWQAG